MMIKVKKEENGFLKKTDGELRKANKFSLKRLLILGKIPI
jgi:hypothetical protein